MSTTIIRDVTTTRLVSQGIVGPQGPQGIPGVPDNSAVQSLTERLLRQETGAQNICAFGDSITAQNHLNTNPQNLYRMLYGSVNLLNYLSYERYGWKRSWNLGVSGNNTTQMVARLSEITTDRNEGCTIVLFMGGTNDIVGLVPVATITANLKTIFDHITRTLNMRLVARPILPRSFWASLTAPQIAQAKADILTVNSWIASYCASNRNAVFTSGLYAAFDDGTGAPKPGYTYDGLHPDAPGALEIAKADFEALRGLFGVSQWPLHTNLLDNPVLIGNGGTAVINNLTLTGSAPDGWEFRSGVTGTNAATLSRNADGSLRVSYTGSGGSTSNNIFLTESISTGYVAGDLLQGYAEVAPVSGSNVRGLEVRVLDKGSVTNNYFALNRGNNAVFPASTLGRGVIATEVFAAQSGSTSIEFRLYAEMNASTSAALVFDVYRVGLFKVD